MSIGKGILLVVCLFGVPLLAWFLSRGLVHGGFGLARHAAGTAMEPWHGRYYEFEGTQVRVFEEEGRLWFVLIDVAHALGWRRVPHGFLATQSHRLRRLEGTRLEAVDLEGLDTLLGRRREIDCGRLLRWARADVVKPWERRQEG